MIKKLSSTFRRKTSGSPPLHLSSPPTPPTSDVSTADPAALAELTAAYSTALSEQNRQAHELRRLRAQQNPKHARKARALTFSAGTPVESRRKKSGRASRDIPFFEPRNRERDRLSDARKRPPPDLAVVKGAPAAWRDENRRASPQLPELAPAGRCFSFDASHAAAHAGSLPQLSTRRASTSLLSEDAPVRRLQTGAPTASQPQRVERRWPLPASEEPERPRLFTPPDGTAFGHIAQRRDRVEARPLLSTCTFLENEIVRMSELLEPSAAVTCCCKGMVAPEGASPGCDCAHRLFLVQSVERLKGILNILEDRYDSIEQFYIKSQEYAKAMGRFYQVSPAEYNKWVEDRGVHHRRTTRKTLR